MRKIESPRALAGMVGETLGPSPWLTITQEMIDRFADVTGDRQWIHVDVERASREAPEGKTIAHGYLTLSLFIQLQDSIYQVENVQRGINYGANRLRFLAPIPVDARIRLKQTIKSAEPVDGGGFTFAFDNIFELEGAERPAVILESLGILF